MDSYLCPLGWPTCCSHDCESFTNAGMIVLPFCVCVWKCKTLCLCNAVVVQPGTQMYTVSNLCRSGQKQEKTFPTFNVYSLVSRCLAAASRHGFRQRRGRRWRRRWVASGDVWAFWASEASAVTRSRLQSKREMSMLKLWEVKRSWGWFVDLLICWFVDLLVLLYRAEALMVSEFHWTEIESR